jgi:hypothetical protein
VDADKEHQSGQNPMIRRHQVSIWETAVHSVTETRLTLIKRLANDFSRRFLISAHPQTIR